MVPGGNPCRQAGSRELKKKSEHSWHNISSGNGVIVVKKCSAKLLMKFPKNANFKPQILFHDKHGKVTEVYKRFFFYNLGKHLKQNSA
jgi:hypothetical protein